MPKLTNPLPQSLPKECAKAAKIFRSFVDSGNNGLDGVIPRTILENAKGFAIFTVVKAGFLFSARAGSGIVIARLEDGSWSAPSAIGTAGVGVGTQAGAEMTDFLIVLNSRSAIASQSCFLTSWYLLIATQRSFMSAGSLTLGGNLSLALGPLGRNGEALGSVNTNGKVAAMYSYSKTRGLFGGISLEGSVIMERQDANAQAYSSPVTVKMLLGGHVDPPPWAAPLIQALQSAMSLPNGRAWVEDGPISLSDDRSHSRGSASADYGYAFGNGVSSATPPPTTNRSSPSIRSSPSFLRKKKGDQVQFPPTSWGKSKEGGAYFSSESDDIPYSSSAVPPRLTQPSHRGSKSMDASFAFNNPTPNGPSTAPRFETHFESDYTSDVVLSDAKSSPAMKHARFNSAGASAMNTRSGSSDFDLLDTPNEFDYSRSTHPAAAFARASGKNSTPHSRNTSIGGGISRNSSTSHSNGPFGSPTPPFADNHNANELHSSIQKLSLNSRSYDFDPDDHHNDSLGKGNEFSRNSTATPQLQPKSELTKPLGPGEGMARAIALYDFQAVESGDLSFKKGTVITVTKMSDSKDDWWTGRALGREGIFPANFVELV